MDYQEEGDEGIRKELENAWRDHLPNQYPGHKPSDYRILRARPDAWIAIKAMTVTSKGVVYYAEITNGKKKTAYKVFIGDEKLTNAFKKLLNGGRI